MSDDAIDFDEAFEHLKHTYIAGVRGFLGWLQAHWQHDTELEWTRQYGGDDPYPGEAHRDGWNACLASLQSALEVYTEEYGWIRE